MTLDDSVIKELYQQLSGKVQTVAQRITQKVQATTQAWDQPISSLDDPLSSPLEPELRRARHSGDTKTKAVLEKFDRERK